MSKDWKQIARISTPDVPPAQLDAIARALDAMEAAFRPLAQAIPPEAEPAPIFQAANCARRCRLN
jgi:hypothetical protein